MSLKGGMWGVKVPGERGRHRAEGTKGLPECWWLAFSRWDASPPSPPLP